MCGPCLGHVWELFVACLVYVWGMFWGVWGMFQKFGGCLERFIFGIFGIFLGYVGGKRILRNKNAKRESIAGDAGAAASGRGIWGVASLSGTRTFLLKSRWDNDKHWCEHGHLKSPSISGAAHSTRYSALGAFHKICSGEARRGRKKRGAGE